MKAKPTIAIPTPCSQNWHSMLPNEQGKFCNSCQKTVVDLSAMSDAQLMELLATSSKICGRISESQLSSFNNLSDSRSSFLWKRVGIAAAFIGFVSLLKAEAKAPVVKPLIEQGQLPAKAPITTKTDTVLTYKKIFGKVTEAGDTTGIAGVTVSIKGTQLQTSTDAKGRYSLNVPVSDNIVLVTRYIGYNYLETKLEISKPSQQYNFVITPNSRLMGEIVVVARPRFAKRVYYAATRPFRVLFRKQPKTVVAYR